MVLDMTNDHATREWMNLTLDENINSLTSRGNNGSPMPYYLSSENLIDDENKSTEDMTHGNMALLMVHKYHA